MAGRWPPIVRSHLHQEGPAEHSNRIAVLEVGGVDVDDGPSVTGSARASSITCQPAERLLQMLVEAQ